MPYSKTGIIPNLQAASFPMVAAKRVLALEDGGQQPRERVGSVHLPQELYSQIFNFSQEAKGFTYGPTTISHDQCMAMSTIPFWNLSTTEQNSLCFHTQHYCSF